MSDLESDVELPGSSTSVAELPTDSSQEFAGLPGEGSDEEMGLPEAESDAAAAPELPSSESEAASADEMYEVELPQSDSDVELDHIGLDGVPGPSRAGELSSQDVAEYYSPPRLLPQIHTLGLSGELSLDILTGWDFRKAQHRQASFLPIILFLMLSPPCTAFSSLMRLWNYKKMSPEKAAALWATGMCFLEHSMELAENQVHSGRYFAFEHPASATSWSQPCVQRVAALPGVMEVTFDQCMLALKSKVAGIPMRKRTRILTNCPLLVELLKPYKCDKTHAHQIIQGQEGGEKRSVWAQCYPPGLVQVLADAICQTLQPA